MAKADRNLEVYNDVLSAEQSIVGTFTNTVGGFNPDTGMITDPIVTTNDCVAVFVRSSRVDNLPFDFQLARGDRVLICAALGAVPVTGDFFTLNSNKWSILIAIESSAGDDSLFRCYVRKG